LNFKGDDDVFQSSASLNMVVNANFDGILNLANITKADPVQLNNVFTGILKGKINASFDTAEHVPLSQLHPYCLTHCKKDRCPPPAAADQVSLY